MGHKSFKEMGEAIGATTAKSERLIAFLRSYAQANQGATPAYDVMADELGCDLEALHRIIGRLETRGAIFVISRNPPRIMLDRPEDGTYSPAEDPDRFTRLLEADGMRHQLGRFITDCWTSHGRGPTLKEMMGYVGIFDPNYVARMASILAERGLIEYGQGIATKPTPLGRQFYGVKDMEQPKAQTVIVLDDRRPQLRTGRGNPDYYASRVPILCEAIARYKALAGEKESPSYQWLCEQLGYSRTSGGAITQIVEKAFEQGLLAEPARARGHSRLQFTDQGRAAYLQPLLEDRVLDNDIEEAIEQAAEPVIVESRTFAPEEVAAVEDRPPTSLPPRAPESAAPTFPILIQDATPQLLVQLVQAGYTVGGSNG
jgi:hypothetical protein